MEIINEILFPKVIAYVYDELTSFDGLDHSVDNGV